MRILWVLSILTIMCTSLMVTGCATPHGNLMKSAQANYQANQYEAALRDAVGALKLKPDFTDAQDMIETFFKGAVDVRESRIKSLEAAPDKFKWDGIVAEYKALIEINQLVKNLPPMALTHKETARRLVFDTKDYTDQLAQASERAAEAHYQEGIRIAASSGDVDTQKKAAKAFRSATEYVPGYKDADDRYFKSREAGIKKMAILPFEDRSGQTAKYGAITDVVTDGIIDSVMNDESAREFLDLVTRDAIDEVMAEQGFGLTGAIDESSAVKVGGLLGIHEIVVGRITTVRVDPTSTRSEKVKHEAVISVKSGTENYTDSSGKIKTRNKYVKKPISAVVTRYTNEGYASIRGSYKIVEAETGRIRPGGTGNFDEKYEFKAVWATFTGDFDAVDRADKQLCRVEKPRPPTDAEMVDEAVAQLVESLATKFKEYAR